MPEMKCTWNEINGRLDVVEGNITEFKDKNHPNAQKKEL